jgi:hypothetical protein
LAELDARGGVCDTLHALPCCSFSYGNQLGLKRLPVLCNLYTKCNLAIRRKYGVSTLILLEIATFHPAEPGMIVRFLHHNDAARRFDCPALLVPHKPARQIAAMES